MRKKNDIRIKVSNFCVACFYNTLRNLCSNLYLFLSRTNLFPHEFHYDYDLCMNYDGDNIIFIIVQIIKQSIFLILLMYV